MSDAPPHRYTAAMAKEIEPRWQDRWAQDGTYRVPNPGEPGFDASKPKFYALDMFPYPSGAGLHVGHPEGYTATDIIGRYKRMRGFNVLHPMGFDAFGLPAEQHAINTGEHPARFTRKTIDTFRRQLQRFGFGYDWGREFATIDESYYKWTQWIFLRIYNSWFDPETDRARPIDELVSLMESGGGRVAPDGSLVRIGPNQKATADLGGEPGLVREWHTLSHDEQRAFIDDHRLAYVGEQIVNWCPALGTVLASEEVIDGRSERGGHPVLRKPLRQWLFRITAYADRLLAGLEGLDWPESTKTQQREWIGRSEGAEIDFTLDIDGDDPEIDRDLPAALRVFTTRPDTICGATYMVVAPEHPLVKAVLDSPRPETPAEDLARYAEWASNRSDLERQESKEKTGCFTGLYAINPATGGRIPIWTADYVLIGYGFGAIMAVPAGDERDFEFAETFGLPIVDVVYPRAIAAMAHYASAATDDEVASGTWTRVLADFLGITTTTNLPWESFASGLEAARFRRSDPTADGPDAAELAEKGFVGARGTIRAEYEASIDDLGVDGFEELRAIFAERRYVRHSGHAFTASGVTVNSTHGDLRLDGLTKADAIERTIGWLESTGHGRRRTNYRLRDWLFSRQRYWGEPFPIVYDERGRHYGVAEATLPVTLPDLDDYQPAESVDPQPLLGKAVDWVAVTAGEAGIEWLDASTQLRRETNTMPGWAGSCWYHIRYCDARNSERFIGDEADAYWLGDNGVDLYIGGAEHAVLHLLYARFWHMMLHDLGHLRSPEPYRKLFHQGLITSHAYQRADKSLVPVDEVEERDGGFVHGPTGDAVSPTIAKMSKSLKNVVNPDDIIEQFGVDTFRLYEMYMGPLEASKPWNTDDTVGLYRFLQRVWRMCVDEKTGAARVIDRADDAIEKLLHRTIAKVGDDIERLSFNTAIAAMIEFVNAAAKTGLTRDQIDRLCRMLSPFAPHVAEEIRREKLRIEGSIATADWPEYDEAMLTDDEVEIPVQLMGKVKARLRMPADADRETMQTVALEAPEIKRLLEGKTVRKVIVVPGQIVNIVAN
ncbi:MAG: class I tRNA ligase family protein [Planctomycetota bacterium]